MSAPVKREFCEIAERNLRRLSERLSGDDLTVALDAMLAIKSLLAASPAVPSPTARSYEDGRVKDKLHEIRRQLEINVEIIKRNKPDPEPRIFPHVIETITGHVYDRLNDLEAMLALSSQGEKPEGDGWIEWKGGECPVPKDTMIYWKLWQGGKGTVCGLDTPHGLDWRHGPNGIPRFNDIIAYRLVQTEGVKP